MKKSKLKEIADTEFSKLRRLQEADENGFCKCISCPKVIKWKYMTIGHYIKRRYEILRYNETNCSPQCFECNTREESDERIKTAHGNGLIDKYGHQILNLLGQAKQKYKTWHESELDYLIKKWRTEIRKLKKEKL